MTLAIVPFTEDHLDSAAQMLAERHRDERRQSPALQDRFADAAIARHALAESLGHPTMRAVAAIEGSALIGFLGGDIVLPPPVAMWAMFLRPRSARIPYECLAARGDQRIDVFREMYAALAPGWLDDGCCSHYVEVAATDDEAIEAFSSLGFGTDITLAVRGTEEVTSQSTDDGLEIRMVEPDAIEDVMVLVDHLYRHHASSPMFFPYPRETRPDLRASEERLLAESGTAFWVAYQRGRPVGMQSFHTETHAEMARTRTAIYLHDGVTDPTARGGGIGSALLARSMAWAREARYAHCSLHYLTANLSGARFWTRHGFAPLTYRMMRHVDERILWARGAE